MNGGEAEAALGWVPHEFEWHVLGDALLGQDRLEAPPVLQGRQTVVEFFTEMAEVWGGDPSPRNSSISVMARSCARQRSPEWGRNAAWSENSSSPPEALPRGQEAQREGQQRERSGGEDGWQVRPLARNWGAG